MIVTADKYELPMGVYRSPQEIARNYNMSEKTVLSYITRGGIRKRDKVKFLRLEVEEENEKLGVQ